MNVWRKIAGWMMLTNDVGGRSPEEWQARDEQTMRELEAILREVEETTSRALRAIEDEENASLPVN